MEPGDEVLELLSGAPDERHQVKEIELLKQQRSALGGGILRWMRRGQPSRRSRVAELTGNLLHPDQIER